MIHLNPEIEKQMQQQIEHVLRFYEDQYLHDKLKELVMEWFFKGLKSQSFVSELKTDNQKEEDKNEN